jgi:hypothetical protein
MYLPVHVEGFPIKACAPQLVSTAGATPERPSIEWRRGELRRAVMNRLLLQSMDYRISDQKVSSEG